MKQCKAWWWRLLNLLQNQFHLWQKFQLMTRWKLISFHKQNYLQIFSISQDAHTFRGYHVTCRLNLSASFCGLISLMSPLFVQEMHQKMKNQTAKYISLWMWRKHKFSFHRLQENLSQFLSGYEIKDSLVGGEFRIFLQKSVHAISLACILSLCSPCQIDAWLPLLCTLSQWIILWYFRLRGLKQITVSTDL